MLTVNKKNSTVNSITQSLIESEEGWNELIEDEGIQFLANAMSEEKKWPIEACLEIVRSNTREKMYIRQATRATLVAETDDMTGFYNKRKFELQLKKEIARSLRHKHTISVLMLDMDKFKLINDNLGHLVGDEAIKILSQLIKKSVRDEDYAARFGGDEFAAILVNTNEGKMVADRLRRLVEKEFKQLLFEAIKKKHPEVLTKINNKNKTKNHIDFFNEVVNGTVSIGISTLIGSDKQKISANELTHQADNAQYLAKNNGRNIVGVHENEGMYIYDKNEQLKRLEKQLLNTRYKLDTITNILEVKTRIKDVLKDIDDKNMIEITNNEIIQIKNKIEILNEKIDSFKEKIAKISSQQNNQEKEQTTETNVA